MSANWQPFLTALELEADYQIYRANIAREGREPMFHRIDFISICGATRELRALYFEWLYPYAGYLSR